MRIDDTTTRAFHVWRNEDAPSENQPQSTQAPANEARPERQPSPERARDARAVALHDPIAQQLEQRIRGNAATNPGTNGSEPITPETSVGIIDDFLTPGQVMLPTAHGENVEQVLDNAGMADTEHIADLQIDSNFSVSNPTAVPIADSATNGAVKILDQVSDHLEAIAADPQGINVVNISQGVSPAMIGDLYLDSFYSSRPQTEKDAFKKALGLDAAASDADVANTVLDQVNGAFAANPTYVAAKQRYDAAVAAVTDAGPVVVVAAGNDRDNAAELSTLGADASKIDTTNVLTNPNAVMVAALNASGAPSAFSSANPENDIAALGEGVPAVAANPSDGTSFAAPQVAAVIDNVRRANPDLSAAEVVDLIRRTAIPLNAPSQDVGAGLLNPIAALDEARSLV
jgi:hypothetical protein